MRVLDNIPSVPETAKNHFRNIEIDVAEKSQVDYTDKVIKDPRIRKFSRPSFSEAEVKEKMDTHNQKKMAEKLEHQRLRAGRMDKQKILGEKENAVRGGEIQEPPKGDIGTNDPNDSNTRSKLKEAVKMGSFNFSQKEREVLNKILNKGD